MWAWTATASDPTDDRRAISGLFERSAHLIDEEEPEAIEAFRKEQRRDDAPAPDRG